MIAAIICAVIAVLLAIAFFICWKCYPHLFHREKPFNSFIKVEVKPYAHYHAPQRVSRLDSTVSENEEKRYSFKNNMCSEGGVRGADVTACPIYASVQENLNKSDSADGNLNNLSKPPKKGMNVKSAMQCRVHLQDLLVMQPVFCEWSAAVEGVCQWNATNLSPNAGLGKET